MTPDDESTPSDDTIETTTEETTTEETSTEETPDGDVEMIDDPAESDESDESAEGDDEGVEAEGTLLEQSQATIDDAHEAVKRVERTDAIGDDTIGIAVTDDPARDG